MRRANGDKNKFHLNDVAVIDHTNQGQRLTRSPQLAFLPTWTVKSSDEEQKTELWRRMPLLGEVS